MSAHRRLFFTSPRERVPAIDRYLAGVVLGLASLMVAAGCGSSVSAGTGGSGNLGGNGTSGAQGGNAVSTGGAAGTSGAASSSGGAVGSGGGSAGGAGLPPSGGAGGLAVATGGTGSGGRGGDAAGGRAGSTAGSTGNAGNTGNAGSSGGMGGIAGAGGQVAGCTFSTSYDIFTSPVDGKYMRATLSPPANFSVVLSYFPSSLLQLGKCAPALPACQTAAAIDAADVIAAMAHPDVKRAFGQLVGHYAAVGDAPMLTVGRYTDDHEFIETETCTGDCTAAPEGVRVLLTLLRNLLTQQLADATCKDVRQP